MNFTEIKTGPESGLLGGIFSGLKEGGDLGQLFSNTKSTNQQTMAREQRLPYELAGLAAGNDKDAMANDLTRATQPGQIEATNATNKTAVMTQEQLQKLLPLDSFNKQVNGTFQQTAGMLRTAAASLAKGDTSIWGKLKEMADKQGPEAQQAFQETYKKYGSLPPQQAAQEATKYSDMLLAHIDKLDPKTRFEMWKTNLEHMEKMLAARNSGSREPSDKMSIDQRISDAEAKKAQLLGSGVNPNDPRVINLVNLVNSLNAARSTAEGMVIPQDGLPGSYKNYGTGSGASGNWGTPSAEPVGKKVYDPKTKKWIVQ